MVAEQRQCPRLTSLGYGELELLCDCGFAKSEDDEPIWRPYPAAVTSSFLFSGQLSVDGRTASNGTDVSFQLKHSSQLLYLCKYGN